MNKRKVKEFVGTRQRARRPRKTIDEQLNENDNESENEELVNFQIETSDNSNGIMHVSGSDLASQDKLFEGAPVGLDTDANMFLMILSLNVIIVFCLMKTQAFFI